MNAAPSRGSRPDRLRLIEAGLVILLLASFVALYVVPTETRLRGVPWWSPILLAALLLAVLVIDARRRKQRHRSEMEDMKEHHRGERP